MSVSMIYFFKLDTQKAIVFNNLDSKYDNNIRWNKIQNCQNIAENPHKSYFMKYSAMC
jgi:hypothetical protein